MRTYAEYLASIFGPGKYQKLTLNAGHDCPNRDGTLGYGGCIYCSNQAFSPAYCHAAATLEEQLQAGRAFFSRKYRDKRWLPYFQISRPIPPPTPTSTSCAASTSVCSPPTTWPVW